MSFVEDRQNSAATDHKASGRSLNLPGLVTQLSPVEQLSFPDTPPLSMGTTPLPGPQTQVGAGVTRPLSNASPAVTRDLPVLQTGALFPIRTTTALRQPVVIPRTGKRSQGTLRPPPNGRRWVVHLVVTCLLILISVSTLM